MRNRLTVGTTAGLACCAALLGGCGSAHSSGRSSAPASAVPSGACRTVRAVLSDGPDPGADPVGYAEAQIRPLQGVHTSDARLGTAVRNLDAAYRRMFSTDGSAAGRRAVTTASRALNAICPGAAP